MSLVEFTEAAITTLIWSETDEEGHPLDDNYDEIDLAPEARASIEADCAAFYESFSYLFTDEHCLHYGPDFGIDGRAGHDFILTRNHHGAGFWDGDWTDEAGKLLTEMSHPYGSINLYAGDDGKLYTMQG